MADTETPIEHNDVARYLHNLINGQATKAAAEEIDDLMAQHLASKGDEGITNGAILRAGMTMILNGLDTGTEEDVMYFAPEARVVLVGICQMIDAKIVEAQEAQTDGD